ncbi:helicase-like transcription factor CHR28 [Bidens hawaiensis]|uniref:helicase-like transcription factor CHR28 n=1 Tax=Bidens hawaiensis TaxID=980011 RepID=UPI0040492BDD
MANGSSPSYGWPFDDYDDGDRFDVTAGIDDEPLDFDLIFNSIGEQQHSRPAEILYINLFMYPMKIESEDCDSRVLLLQLNLLADSQSSTAPCNRPAHGANEHFEPHNNNLFASQTNLPVAYDIFDRPMPVPEHVTLSAANHEGAQDFSLFNNYETNFEINDTFGVPDGMHSVTNSHQTLEIPDSMMNFIGDEFSMLFDEPLYVGSSSSNHNGNIESEEHLMQNLSRNIAIDYETLPEVDKESTSGPRVCDMPNKKQLGCVKSVPTLVAENKKSDNGLAVPLLRHQRIALSWMSKRETKSTRCCGGILADDQGLGKTVSAIALILKERSPPSSSVSSIQTKDKKIETLYLDEDEHTNRSAHPTTSLSAGTLIVCPTNVLRQWCEELQNKVTNEANLSVLVYYGVNRTKDPVELTKYDVIITTYAIVSMEVTKPFDEDDDETKIKISPTKKRKYPPTESTVCPLAKLRWFRVILDEAQSIKNYKTQVARACWGLRAKRRWCLSGTPIQNSIDDLYSYFRFLKYDPYSVYKKFCTQIKAPIQRNPNLGYKKLQVILKTIMLRRTKGTLLKGEPIISLPPKTIILKRVDFSAEERSFYHSLEAEARALFEKYAAAGTVKENYVNILLMLLRLRQACDHPLLVKRCGSSSYRRRLSVEKAKQLPQQKLNRLLNCLEASLAICSICNDPPQDAVVTTCEHVFCNQCILEYLSSDENECPYSECKTTLNKSSVLCKSTLTSSISDHDSVESSQPVDSLKIEAAKALDSSKMKAAIEVLKSITVNDHNIKEKAIVFSQWTGMLDLLEVCLKHSSIGYRRLDGTMSVAARDKAVKDFNRLPEVSVIIMSLKAASLGLNMVAACHVILLDIWWNPTIEDQVIDRAHRIGQTRPVTVLRFTVKDTVEDRILALQKKKRKMVALAFGDDNNGGSQTRLTFADMKYLFQA